MQRMHLTKSSVAALPATAQGQKRYADDLLRGFGVIVGSRRKDGMVTKTYIVEREIKRKTVRVVIGPADQIPAEKARDKAMKILARMREGENPNITKQLAIDKAVSALTLDEAFGKYLEARKNLKQSTRDMYRYTIDKYLGDWKSRTLAEITKSEIATRHAKIAALVAEGKQWQGHDVANAAMRVIRAIYNFAKELDDDLPENPVMRLSRTRAWFESKRRETVIQADQLHYWHKAVLTLDDTFRDYLLTCLFTGLRRREATRMRWEDINLNTRTLTIPDTKNGKPLVLPISSYLLQLLQTRIPETGKGWVFKSDSKSGHIEEPKFATDDVFKASGVKATVHDLRRTFITIAESQDISPYAIKRLVNHALPRDVTAGYINLSVERLRAPLEKIADRLLQLINNPPKVVQLQRAES